jgi:ribosomal protein S12 methylthiotransferase accessory factor
MKNTLLKKHTSCSPRNCLPEDTLAKILPLLSQMGITRIANVTGLDNIGIPVVTVCRPNSKSVAVAQGKGKDLVSAKVSGIMEAIETYHAENAELSLKLSSYSDLMKNNNVVNIAELAGLSVNYFDIHKPVLWVEGKDLMNNKPKFLPYEIVHTHYTANDVSRSGSFAMSSNGLASGNHLYEAINHGICEVIERDAVSLWAIEREFKALKAGLRRVSIKSIDDPQCIELLERYTAAGVLVGLWNITSDVGLPSFFCMIVGKESNAARPLYPACGSGTHPNKAIALSRALTEAAQARLTLISGSRDDLGVADYCERQDQIFQRNIREELEFSESLCQYTDIKSWSNETLLDDFELIIRQLKAVNLNSVVMVDLSRCEMNIPVVRIVVPGLEGIHDSPGYVRGRRALRLVKALSLGKVK